MGACCRLQLAGVKGRKPVPGFFCSWFPSHKGSPEPALLAAFSPACYGHRGLPWCFQSCARLWRSHTRRSDGGTFLRARISLTYP